MQKVRGRKAAWRKAARAAAPGGLWSLPRRNSRSAELSLRLRARNESQPGLPWYGNGCILWPVFQAIRRFGFPTIRALFRTGVCTMANLNKVMLIGNLTRDPEVRTFSNGGKVAAFGFAVNNRKKNASTG